jgi:uncharacterized protein
MRITVLGATGMVGSATVAEARRRGHTVTAASRSTGIDATNPATVRRLIADQDVLIAATRPIPGHEPELVAVTQAVVTALKDTTVRLDWTYLSPAAHLTDGPRTGKYRTAKDDLLVNAEGKSHITAADLAVALLDEAEAPQHRGTRFTAAY